MNVSSSTSHRKLWDSLTPINLHINSFTPSLKDSKNREEGQKNYIPNSQQMSNFISEK